MPDHQETHQDDAGGRAVSGEVIRHPDDPRRTAAGTWLPGVSGNPGGYPGPRTGQVSFSRRLQAALLTATESGRTVADVIALKVADYVLHNPGDPITLRWLEWLEEREHGKAPLVVDLMAHAAGIAPQAEREALLSVDDATRTAGSLDEYLATLAPLERAETVRVLARVAAHVPTALPWAQSLEAQRSGQAGETAAARPVGPPRPPGATAGGGAA